MSDFTKTLIAEKAKNGIVTVRFTKMNGEEREMKCTLLSEYLPAQQDIEENSSRSNDQVLAVWDVEANGWRSFRVDSVKEFICD